MKISYHDDMTVWIYEKYEHGRFVTGAFGQRVVLLQGRLVRESFCYRGVLLLGRFVTGAFCCIGRFVIGFFYLNSIMCVSIFKLKELSFLTFWFKTHKVTPVVLRYMPSVICEIKKKMGSQKKNLANLVQPFGQL